MKKGNNFIGWGCQGVWTINEGFSPPKLYWENETGQFIETEAYGGGCGTKVNPFQIGTAEQLNEVGLNIGDFGTNFMF